MIDTALRLLEMGVDKIWPDETEAKQAKARLSEMALKGELQDIQNEFELAKQQILLNAKEAESADIFIAGWRPFIGWVCGGGFAWHFIVRDFTLMFAQIAGADIDPSLLPVLDNSELRSMLYALLGLGGIRGYEKMKGVARSRL